MCVSSFLPLWVLSLADGYDSGPKFVNTGCVKRKQKPQTNNKKGGEKKVQREQLLAISCAFSKHFHLKGFFFPYP